MKWNESGFRPPLCTYRLNWARRCAHIGWDGPGEPTVNGEINVITLHSSHRTRHSSPGGLMLGTLPFGHEDPHNSWSLRVSRGETFCLFETRMTEWGSNPRFATFQAGSFNPSYSPTGSIPVIFVFSVNHANWNHRTDSGPTVQVFRRRSPKAGLMLAHRLRRWANIKPALDPDFVFSGTPSAWMVCEAPV